MGEFALLEGIQIIFDSSAISPGPVRVSQAKGLHLGELGLHSAMVDFGVSRFGGIRITYGGGHNGIIIHKVD